MTVLRSGSASDVGRVRAVNEDQALESETLFAVADGMGGHAGGEIASRTAIDTLAQSFQLHPTHDGLVDAVHEANISVWRRSHDDPDLRGMGTTLTATALVTTPDGDRLVLANVGDSRTYRFRDGTLMQLTHDHSVAEELVDRGELSEEEAAIHPHRHILTRALGVSPEVDIDVWQVVPRRSDRYLLCSDGLTNEVSTDRMHDVLVSNPDPQAAADALVRLANASGGNDNITVVIVEVMVGEDGAPDDEDAMFAAAFDGDRSQMLASTASRRPPPPTLPPPPGTVLGRADAGPDVSARPTGRDARNFLPSRRLTIRLVAFLLVLAALVAGAWAALRWYVDSSYFVKLHHGQVVIYEGREQAVLGMNAHIVQYPKPAIPADCVPPQYLGALQSGQEESSLAAARHYVRNIRSQEPSGQNCPTSTTGTATTTTTAPTPSGTTTTTKAGG